MSGTENVSVKNNTQNIQNNIVKKPHPNEFLNKNTHESISIEKKQDNSSDGTKNTRSDLSRPTPEIQVKSAIPKKRQELLKWYGWGYKDSKFLLENKVARFTGSRYQIGDQQLPHFVPWVQDTFKVNVERPAVIPPVPRDLPPSRLPSEAERELSAIAQLSVDALDRLVHAHGQTLRDVSSARSGRLPRIPDAVVWPTCHDDVIRLVRVAERRRLALLPFGGGTAVSGATTCPATESRPIISVDTTAMNAILWLDRDQLLACCQSGIVGQDLERELRARGFTCGHEPDSFEFSTLGGWVATRASGMKKNTYGNIEDLVVHARMVTPRGVLERGCRAPRISSGPEFDRLMLGSEGTLGVVTDVTIKIRPAPAATRYGSLAFPDFESGYDFMRAVARERLQPASVRLMDNEQFRFGHALRPTSTWSSSLLEGVKRAYITRVRGFDPMRMCVATLLYEGSPEEVREHERRLNALAARSGGVAAGETNGKRGYMLTFVIAYIRDLALDYDIVAESFETSVSWDRALALCNNVKRRLAEECQKNAIQHFLASCRLTQTYDAGCCIYFYFAFNCESLSDPVSVYEDIEHKARDEIIANGGSISHHHGVGKLRAAWYSGTVSQPGTRLLHAAKQALDPDNVFAAGNMALGEVALAPPHAPPSKL